MAERTCPGCGHEIRPGRRERNRKIWCSEACRLWRYRYPDGPPRPTAGQCAACGQAIRGRRVSARYCSSACAASARPKQVRPRKPRTTDACLVCTADITHTRADCTTCSKACRTKLEHLRAGGRTPAAKDADLRRRARNALVPTEYFRHLDVFERDGWVCQICGRAVDPALVHPHPMSKSLDHIVPISKGGTHAASNAQLAHLRCNIVKGDRLAIEPPLAG